MADLTPWQQLRAERDGRPDVSQRPKGRRRLDPETQRHRNAERTRRHMEARRRAWNVLATRHAEEFEALLEAERAGVDAERGPLPGDESESTLSGALRPAEALAAAVAAGSGDAALCGHCGGIVHDGTTHQATTEFGSLGPACFVIQETP